MTGGIMIRGLPDALTTAVRQTLRSPEYGHPVVREVAAGFECGIGLLNYDDIKVNDVLEGYRVVETKRTLE